MNQILNAIHNQNNINHKNKLNQSGHNSVSGSGGGMGRGVGQPQHRGIRTSYQQHEIYLNFLQNDKKFCMGIRNPMRFPNYVAARWEYLANELNECWNGPTLNVKQWQKRFSDWKHATRAKFRKIHNQDPPTTTGSPTDNNSNTNVDRKSELVLSKLEKAALSLWGTQSTKSLKMKAQLIQSNQEDSPQHEHHQQSNNFSSHLYYPQQVMEIIQEPMIRLDTDDVTIIKEEDPDEEVSVTMTKGGGLNNNEPDFYRRQQSIEIDGNSAEDVPQNLSNKSNFINYDELDGGAGSGCQERTQDESSCKPFTVETALENFQDGMRKLNENLERLTDIKRKKLEFEIAKFKYFHPDFNF